MNPAGWMTAALPHFLSVSLHEKRRFGLTMSEQELIRERGAEDSRAGEDLKHGKSSG